MIWGMVTYAEKGQWRAPLQRLRALFSRSTGWVVNNLREGAIDQEIQGENEQFEFGGYLQLCERMEPLEGPYLILNDTLFRTHSLRGWLKLLAQLPQSFRESDRVIYGDIRFDGTAFRERPNPFLASWVFLIPNRALMCDFRRILQEVLQADFEEISPEYASFLQDWIEPKHRWGGWHGSAQDRARKRQCILWEHRLSLMLQAEGIELRSIGEWDADLYQRLRLMDRLKTRWKAWMG
jgi:hypothetical protein